MGRGGQQTPTGDGPRAVERIRGAVAQMPAAMARIAEMVLHDPRAPLDLSITDLASRAGASPATVTRFCRLLGYSGYVQFRVALASDLGHRDAYESWRTDVGREFDPQDAPSDLLRSLLAAHTRALEATSANVDLDGLTHIAKRIWASPHLDIYGVGGSAAIAQELQGRLYRIGVNAHAWGEVHAGLASAAILPDDAVVVAISTKGRTHEIIELVERATDSGAFTVAITSDRQSPLARVADSCIVSATVSEQLQPDDMSAKVSQLFLLDLLYLLIAQQDLVTTADRLAATRLAVSPHHLQPEPT
jgi:DNA-binding MurR/RpiR family transcriptional regulator